MIRTLVITVCCLGLFAFGPSDAKWTMISGKVVDSQSGEALIGAKVELSGSDKVVYTDPEGYFELVAPVDASSELTVGYIAYQDVAIPATKMESTATIALSAR